MPRFPVGFGKRRSTADAIQNAALAEPAAPSFRVLERAEVTVGKSFDGGARLAARTQMLVKAATASDASSEDNIFADLKTNRGSGSSNTTKTTSTDNSSRHSNASTAPSSTDTGVHDDWKMPKRKPVGEAPAPPPPKSSHSGSGFLRSAGRTFSFGGQKKQLPIVPGADEPLPDVPIPDIEARNGRPRTMTTSTETTVVAPRLDTDVNLDLGGDFGKLLLGFDKRSSVATVLDDQARQQPRSLTGNRQKLPTPAPIQIDKASRVDASPYTGSSQTSHDNLLLNGSLVASPITDSAPPVPRHASPFSSRPRQRPSPSPESSLRQRGATNVRRSSNADFGEDEDEDSQLLKDSLAAVSKFMAGGNTKNSSNGRYRRNEDAAPSSWKQSAPETRSNRFEKKADDDSLFDSTLSMSSKVAQRYVSRRPSPPRNKVMTPAQFERYRQDKERQQRQDKEIGSVSEKQDAGKSDDEDNYEEDEDDAEKARQQAKQRKKQEAHMTVYRQQMMKVTGESASGLPSSRPSLQSSFSAPNLPGTVGADGGEDEDEEVPLAILAAHGFPSKTRPPARLSVMMSNPNLRASQQPSYQRPSSVVGEPAGSSHSRLPAFARHLPQDPFVGAGLVNNPVRESIALGGGAPAPSPSPGPTQSGPLPPGGLVGVIANEERSRAMRRGSPAIDNQIPNTPQSGPGFDPMAGIPPHTMYQMAPQPGMVPGMTNPMILTPGDQAQIHMNQQMQQFMQMQMQFMQMMASQGGQGQMPMLPGMPPMGNLSAGGSMDGMGRPDMMARHSFVGNGSLMDLPRPDLHGRTMSMVQPSSASWIQQPPMPGYAPSIRAQGQGYAPSIAPSERSNIGLPGRYRPVSHAPPPNPLDPGRRVSTMSGALGGFSAATGPQKPVIAPLKSGNGSDDDDEEGWEAMRARREKKRSLWKSKKSIAGLASLIS